MSFQNIAELKYFINNNINTNGQALITGAKLNTALNGLAEMVGQGIDIPVPQITRDYDTILAHCISSGSGFRELNPEYFLFRYRRSRRNRGGRGPGKGSNRWVHPVHLDGSKWAGSGFFGGQPVLSNSIAPSLRNRQTEWPVAPNDYDRTRISFHGREYYRNRNTGLYGEVNFPVALNMLDLDLTGNGRSYGYPRAVHFKLAIAIDNPAYQAGNGQCPKIFGPLSHTFSYYPKREAGFYVGWGLKLHCSYPKMR